MPRRIIPIAERFWNKVTPLDQLSCWEWEGNTNEWGYGLITVGGRGNRKHLRAHRVSYELHYGPIPNGELIRHDCDNPPCVNPSHLLSGTQLDNIHDMLSRNRGRWRNHSDSLASC